MAALASGLKTALGAKPFICLPAGYGELLGAPATSARQLNLVGQ